MIEDLMEKIKEYFVENLIRNLVILGITMIIVIAIMLNGGFSSPFLEGVKAILVIVSIFAFRYTIERDKSYVGKEGVVLKTVRGKDRPGKVMLNDRSEWDAFSMGGEKIPKGAMVLVQKSPSMFRPVIGVDVEFSSQLQHKEDIPDDLKIIEGLPEMTEWYGTDVFGKLKGEGEDAIVGHEFPVVDSISNGHFSGKIRINSIVQLDARAENEEVIWVGTKVLVKERRWNRVLVCVKEDSEDNNTDDSL